MTPANDSSAVIHLPRLFGLVGSVEPLPVDEPSRRRPAPKLVVPSSSVRCPAGHEFELPAEYAARRDVFCPQCRKAFSPGRTEVLRAEKRALVGMPGRLVLHRTRRTRPPAEAAPPSPAATAVKSGNTPATALAPIPVRERTMVAVVAVSPRTFERLLSATTWAVSAALHAAAVLVLALLVASAAPPPEDRQEIIVTSFTPPPTPSTYEELRRRDIFTNRVNRPTPDDPVPLPEVPNASDPQEDAQLFQPAGTKADIPAIDENVLLPTGAIGTPTTGRTPTLGLGAGASMSPAPPLQIFSRLRSTPENRLKAARTGGGGEDTENAVEKALEWLAEHQLGDGSWLVDGGRNRMITTTQRPAKGEAVEQQQERPFSNHDLATSGLATLAFLGAGYDSRAGKYKETVAKALDFIIRNQKDTGCWADHSGNQEMHSQGILTLALVEAYLLAPNGEERDKLKAAAQRGVQFIVDAQYPYSGWSYYPYAIRSKPTEPARPQNILSGIGVEQSVVIWNGMALKAARTAGLSVDGGAMTGMVKWLDDAQGAGGNYAYSGVLKGNRVEIGTRISSPCMNAAALMMRLWTGTKPGEKSTDQTAALVLDLLEKSKGENAPRVARDENAAPDIYYLHHGSVALFQMGGDFWLRWNKLMKPLVLKSQAEDGSWGTSVYASGRALATSLGTLTLESYYRYSPLYR